MDTHGQVQRIAAAYAIALSLCSAALADLGLVYGGSFDLRIPATGSGKAWAQEAVVNVPDHITVIDVDVSITLTHTSVFDLEVILAGPNGARLRLNWYTFDEFFEGQDYTGAIFDDEASASIELADAPFAGRFTPKAPSRLDVFDGIDAYGPWRLQIYDWWYSNTGTLEEFKLILNTPEPATILTLILGAGLAGLFRPRRIS
jgi:subtilisin-like proprotein convertase family protein